ncbi:hypothetical protein ABKV19_003456 [Rosa sericea]
MADKSDIEHGIIEDECIEDPVLIEDEGIVGELENNLAAKLRHDSPLPISCCIFRVPEVVRRQNKEAYEPDIVSIGPFHRGGKSAGFQFMENMKQWYLQGLLLRTNTSLGSLIKSIMKYDKQARDCYAEQFHHLNQIDFVEMLIVDGCFLIELFQKVYSIDLQDKNDPIFNVDSMLECLYHDLMLLENQLPWFVLECLYNLTHSSTQRKPNPSLTDLVCNFFRQSMLNDNIFNHNRNFSRQILHIIDMLRMFMVVPSKDSLDKYEHQEEDYYESKDKIELLQGIPSATDLSKAGIKFTCEWDCIMNIQFKNGVFNIPPLVIEERMRPLFRNVIAFEQCYYNCQHKITSYAVLMDNLIETSEDVEFLCKEGILATKLSHEDASQFFKQLYTDTTIIEFYYKGFCNDVNEYYDAELKKFMPKAKWKKWIEAFMSDYCDTPWTVMSLVAAFILLVLTFLQTVYTIQQYYH